MSTLPSLWVLVASATSAVFSAAASSSPPSYKPHIVFVVIDDLGSHDLGLHGSSIRTSTCDALARDGVYLSDYYVLPSCSPTRSAIFSGRYPLHTGLNNYIPCNSTTGLPPDEQTLPQVLSGAGYRRRAVGKWHLGHSAWSQTPTYRGFESFFGFYGGGEDHFTHMTGPPAGYDMRRDREEFCGAGCSEVADERGNYSTRVFTREAVGAIEEHGASGSSDPLFLYLAYQAVHAPAEVPPEYEAPYESAGWSPLRKTYAGMLSAVDEGVANVTGALRAAGLWDDTLLVFTTDNGGPTDGCAVQGSSNWPLRGGKCSVWEGGTAGDGFLSGPALSKLGIPSGGSRAVTHLFHCVDWLPTLAAVAGAVPAGKPLDGVDQLGTLRGGPPAREELFVGITDDQVGVHGPAMRRGRWKIIEGGTGGGTGGWSPLNGPRWRSEGGGGGALRAARGSGGNVTYLLFDLSVDRGERDDLAALRPDVVEVLSRALEVYKEGGVPQQRTDPKCTLTGLVNTSVGWTWMPWCSRADRVVVYS